MVGRVIETQRFSDVEIFIEDVNNIHKQVVGKKTTGWDKDELLSYEKTIYDAAGRVVLTITLDDEGYEQPTGYKYDAAGKQIAIADANDYGLETADYTENTETGFYEITDTVLDDILDDDIETYDYVSTTEYEGNRRKSVTDDRGYTTEFEYDALNRVIKTVHPNSVVVEGGAQAVHTYTHTGYDYLGRKVWESNPVIEEFPEDVNDSDIKIYQYDTAGRLITAVLPDVNDPENSGQPASPLYDYYYDDLGNLEQIVDPKERATKFAYNHLNQQICRELPDGSKEYRHYDELGRMVKEKDFKGQVVLYYYYDQFNCYEGGDFVGIPGQLRFEDYYATDPWPNTDTDPMPDADTATPDERIEYRYNRIGRLKDIIESRGTTTYNYDAEGYITSISSPEGTINYNYNPITNRNIQTWTDNTKVENLYDILGRLEVVITQRRAGYPTAGYPELDEQTIYTYNSAGSLKSVLYENGIDGNYGYDALNRLTDLTWTNSSGQICRYQYEHFADGMRSCIEEYDSSDDLVSEYFWSYDNINRLTQEQFNDISDSNDFTDEYIYDIVGNRLNKNIIVGAANSVEYTYNDLDQLETEDSNGDTVSYLYDDNGSLWRKVYGPLPADPDNINDPYDAFEYNLQGRLSLFTPYSGSAVSYTYDSYGNRVGKSVTGLGSISYLVDRFDQTGYSQVLERNDGSNVESYIIGSDVIALATGASANSIIYFVYDGHGSVRYDADYSGSVLSLYRYDAYGNALGFTPADSLYYTGEMYDSDLDLYYLRARYYNPQIGSFISSDTYPGSPQDPISLHKYLYCHADPINGIDPLGLEYTLMQKVVAIGIAMNITSLSMNITRGLLAGIGGNYAESSEAFAWALVDALFLSLPFSGPGAGLAQTAGPVVQNVMSYSKMGMSASALWGYVSMMARAGDALDGDGKSEGRSSKGPRGGEFMEKEGPGAWYKFKYTNKAAAKYQAFRNKKPLGWDYYYNRVRFDGWRDGVLIENKHNWKSLVQKRTGKFYGFIKDVILKQARDQRSAANGLKVIWEFSDKEAADACRRLFAENNYNFDVIHVPAAK